MCGFLDAVGSFFQSPVGHIVTAAATIAVAAVTGNPFAIIAAVGSTLGAVGSVTGNQTLSTVGSVIGAVGVVGGLANAAGLISATDIFGTSDVFSGAAGAANSFGPTGEGELGLPTAGGPPADTSIVSSIANQVAPPEGAIPEAAAPNVNPDVTPNVTPNVTPPVAADATPPPTATPGTATGTINADYQSYGNPPATAAPAGSQTPGIINQGVPGGETSDAGFAGSVGSDVAPGGGIAPVSGAAAPPVTGAPASSGITISSTGAGADGTPPTTSSAWDTVSKWFESHPTLALGALMSAGSFLSGATSPLTPAQVTALQAQAAQNQAAANFTSQQQQMLAFQQSNLMQPLPVATRTPTPPVGMINQPKLAPVTGHV